MAFKSYLLSLGVSDPVTKSVYGSGAIYFEKLGEELCTVLLEPLKVHLVPFSSDANGSELILKVFSVGVRRNDDTARGVL